MKCISAFIYVMLSSLSLLAPTDAAPDSMVARALPHPASVADAKTYLAARGYIANYGCGPSNVNHTLQ
jgi:hypothetical protein